MQNLKIRVNNEAEAEEVKRLAVKAGYTLDALFGKKWSAEFCYLVLCEDMSAGFGNEIMADGDKPLSIGELWAMTNPMREYLEKQPDGTYALVLRGDLCKESDIEIPEGMNYAYDAGSFIQFTKQEMGYRDSVLVWQREQDEPFLTPECTLNDQYSEIEQVRQHNHYFKDVSGLNEIDVYMVLKLFNVTDPCLQHIAKKALCAGQRGHKDFKKDLQDILDTAKRAVEINN